MIKARGYTVIGWTSHRSRDMRRPDSVHFLIARIFLLFDQALDGGRRRGNNVIDNKSIYIDINGHAKTEGTIKGD
jgi:hypothetical protein